MLPEKFKTRVTIDQLNVIYKLVHNASQLTVKDLQQKLLICHMISIHKRLLAKWTYPTKLTTVSLTPTEAIAFWLMFHEFNFTDPFVLATINPILTDIHRQLV